MADAFKADIFFEDEAPALGCGKRRVNVRLGRKWAYISDLTGQKTVRMTLAQFESLKPRRVDSPSAMPT